MAVTFVAVPMTDDALAGTLQTGKIDIRGARP
jgi:hypothetical protein